MPDDPAPRLADLAVPGPLFLRFLRKATAWGDLDALPAERVEDVVRAVFAVTDSQQSLFRVETDADYRRVVVGLCSRRDSSDKSKDPFRFVPFRPEELDAVGIVPRPVAEDFTGCYVANRRLHYDASATPEQLRELCLKAFAARRDRAELRRPALSSLHEVALAEGCPARPSPPACHAADCLTLTAVTAPPGPA